MNVNEFYEIYLKAVKALGLCEKSYVLIASVSKQKITLYYNGKSENEYQMSSSKNPPSCLENSLGTPCGLHEISEKIGDGEPMGMVFEGRKPIGQCYWECSEEKQSKNLITTRILRLAGLEEGVNKSGNVDTYNRFIYIHGTNHEDKLGRPSSSGCLQVSNQEAIELFKMLPIGSHLYIIWDN